MAEDPGKQFETTQEAAERLGINESQVRKYAIAGKWKGATKFGKAWVFPRGSHPDRSTFGPKSAWSKKG